MRPAGSPYLIGGNGAVQHGGDVVHDHLVHGDAQVVVGGGVDKAVVVSPPLAIKSLVAMVYVAAGSKSLPPTVWMVTRLMVLGAK